MTRRMWDDDIQPVHDVPAERILAAVEKAREAFWASIGESFPEVTTGDMAPGDELELEWATNEVVSVWLMWNHPSAPPYEDVTEDDDLGADVDN